ncbi:hypothetical protein MKX01_031575, partial [Papaver californicum]
KSGSMVHIANGEEVEEDEVSGPNVIHVHLKCLLWAPQVYHVGESIMNLEMEVGRGSKLKCSCCGLKGAALGCYIPSCKNTYHFPCAFGISGCRLYDEGYLMLCPSHSGLKFPHEKTKNLAKDNSLAVRSQEPPALGKLVKRPFKGMTIEEPPASTLPLRPCQAINVNMSRKTGRREQPIIQVVQQPKRKRPLILEDDDENELQVIQQPKRKRRLIVEEDEENELQVMQQPKRKRRLILEHDEENEFCDTNQFLNYQPPNNEEEDEEQVAPEDPNS